MAITQLLLAAKAVLTDPALTDGVTSVLTLNKDGRLRTSVKPGYYTLGSQPVTNAGDQAAFDVSDASSLMFLLKNTGTATATAGAFVFEASPDSTNGTDGTWVTVLASRSNSNANETSVTVGSIAAGASFGFAWRLSVVGYRWFRVRCTTSLTTGAIFTCLTQRESYAIDPNPVIPTHAVTQSGTWTVTNNSAAGSTYATVTTASALSALPKGSAGSLFELSVFNSSAAVIYVKLYNKAGSPVPLSDTPLHVIPIAAGAALTMEFGALGKRFTNGIALGITGGAANTDATAVAAGILVSATYV